MNELNNIFFQSLSIPNSKLIDNFISIFKHIKRQEAEGSEWVERRDR